MKFVSYTKNNYYFLTDAQFTSIVDAWSKSQSAWVETLGALLPPPKTPAGTLPEHLGMEIRFCKDHAGFPNSPGWIGYSPAAVDSKDGKELARSALYYRARIMDADRLSYQWQEVNVKRPHVVGGMGMVDHGTTTEDVDAFFNNLNTLPIDEIISNPELRGSVSFDPLLPSYFLE